MHHTLDPVSIVPNDTNTFVRPIFQFDTANIHPGYSMLACSTSSVHFEKQIFCLLSRKWLKRSIEVLEMGSLRYLTQKLQRSNPNPVLIVTLPRNEWIIPDVFTYFSQIHCHRLCHSSGRELKNKESEMSFLEESKNIFRGKVWSGTDLYTLGISAEYNHMIIWSYDQMVFLQNTIIHISIW